MRRVIFLILYTLSIDASAFSVFDKNLNVYICNSEAAAVACNLCKKEQGVTFQFKVNINSQVVLRQIYENGKIYNASALDSCKIVDEKNWSCNEYKSYGNGGYFSSKSQMNNGRHYSALDAFSVGVKSLNIPSLQTNSYMCAK